MRREHPCPALWILRGAMGHDTEGRELIPQCRPDQSGRCGHCHTTIQKKGTRNG